MQTVDFKDIANLVGGATGDSLQSDVLSAETRLLGAIPALDSLALMNLIVSLEKRYGFKWHDDEMEESTFLTLGSLTSFVQLKVDSLEAAEQLVHTRHQGM